MATGELRNISFFHIYIFYMYRYLLSIEFACRHVIIPRTLVKFVPKDRLMTENEWRDLGIQQSRGWENYMVHARERHVSVISKNFSFMLLFLFEMLDYFILLLRVEVIKIRRY